MSDVTTEHITHWLRSTKAASGTIVRGVRFADETFVSDVDTKDYPALALEQAWRIVSDAFQILSAQKLPPTRLSWVYEKAVLHCVRRGDGAIFGVFVTKKAADVDMNGLNRMLNEFLHMTGE